MSARGDATCKKVTQKVSNTSQIYHCGSHDRRATFVSLIAVELGSVAVPCDP